MRPECMDEQQYLTERVDDQLEWYQAKATVARRRYKTLRMVEFVSAALVPLVVAMGASDAHRIVAASLGVMAAAATGYQSLNRYQENWVEYRAVAEQLKSLRFAFLTSTPPFDGEDRLPVFVEHVESVMCGEHASWGNRMATKSGPRQMPKYLGND